MTVGPQDKRKYSTLSRRTPLRRTSTIRRCGKRGRQSQRANRTLYKTFLEKGITRCEICSSDSMLSFAHRQKRVNYRTAEELSDFNEVLLLCIPCHQEIEYDKALTNYWFTKLR